MDDGRYMSMYAMEGTSRGSTRLTLAASTGTVLVIAPAGLVVVGALLYLWRTRRRR